MTQVFHGMLGDVVKENFMRLVVSGQQALSPCPMISPVQYSNQIDKDYLQWLLRPGGDRFFRSWKKPALASSLDFVDVFCAGYGEWLVLGLWLHAHSAKEYLESHRETCSSEDRVPYSKQLSCFLCCNLSQGWDLRKREGR